MTTFTYQERFKTVKGVFDNFTERNLFELQSRNHFDELISPLFVGKESNVFLASKGKKQVIIKIYRMQNREFKRMYQYIKQDPRYENLKNKNREIIISWTQREYKNLLRAQKFKVDVPEPLAIKNNVLVISLIGKDQPAPQLKDTQLDQPEKTLQDILKQVKKLYQGELIHGDLSSFNILMHQNKPYLIDFSQATLIKTPNAEELLERDLKNLLQFFNKLGIKKDLAETLKYITKK